MSVVGTQIVGELGASLPAGARFEPVLGERRREMSAAAADIIQKFELSKFDEKY